MSPADKKWKTTGLVILITGLLFLLSLTSDFQVKGPYEVTWDVAVMLTPWGLVKNLVLEETLLTKYYAEITPRRDLLQQPWLALLLVLHLLACAGTWHLLTRRRDP